MRISRLIIFLLVAVTWSCSDSTSEPTSAFSNKPDAVAAEDAKSGGVYKGVIVGSSGFFTVVLQKGLMVVNVTLDGESRSLSTTSLSSWVSGQLIKNAVFVSGDWSATFSVGIDGRYPNIIFSIPGHPAAEAVIVKEVSTAVVRVFEGTYTGTSSGTWNFFIQGPVFSGISRTADGSRDAQFFGVVNGNNIIVNSVSTISGSGTIVVDNATGTWAETDTGESGNWTGKRIL